MIFIRKQAQYGNNSYSAVRSLCYCAEQLIRFITIALSLYGKDYILAAGDIFIKFHSAFLEKYAGGLYAVGIRIFVAVIYHTLYAGLYYRLCTLIAREQRNIYRTAAEAAGAAVQNGVELRMAHEGILCIESCIALPLPWHVVVAAAGRHTVISDRNYLMLVVDDTGSHLCGIILAALSREHCNSHEVFVPVYIVSPFHKLTPVIRF